MTPVLELIGFVGAVVPFVLFEYATVAPFGSSGTMFGALTVPLG